MYIQTHTHPCIHNQYIYHLKNLPTFYLFENKSENIANNLLYKLEIGNLR